MVKASVPQDCLPFRCQLWDQGRLPYWLTGHESHAPTTSPSDLIVFQNSMQSSGKHSPDIYCFITRTQLWKSQMEKVHRARYGGVVWRSARVPPAWHFDLLTNLRALSISLFKSLYNSISRPTLCPKDWEGDLLKVPALLYNSLFLVSSPILRLSRGPPLSYHIKINSSVIKKGPIITIKRHFYHLRNFKGFGTSVSRTQIEQM